MPVDQAMEQDRNISSYKQNCLHKFHKFLHHSDRHYSLLVCALNVPGSVLSLYMLKHIWQPLVGCILLADFQLAANPLTSSDHVCNMIMSKLVSVSSRFFYTFLCGSERFNRESSDSSSISMVTLGKSQHKSKDQ